MSSICTRLLLALSFVVFLPVPSMSGLLYRPVVDPDTNVELSLYFPGSREPQDCWFSGGGYGGGAATVIGVLPPQMDLLDDNLMQKVLSKGRDYALTQCKDDMKRMDASEIRVNLVTSEEFKRVANPEAVVSGNYKRSDDYSTLGSYNNRAVKREAQRRVEEERQRKQVQSRLERSAEATKQLKPVLQKYGAERLVTCTSLMTNPFVFEGRVVAIFLMFNSMLERDKGLFTRGEMFDCLVVASGIPSGTFSTQRAYLLLAGRVIGKTEVKMPLGPQSLPHLKFVGVHACTKARCAEFAPYSPQ